MFSRQYYLSGRKNHPAKVTSVNGGDVEEKIGTAPIIIEEREAEKWLIITLSVQ